MSGSRAAVIYYCPFCAEEDLRPVEEPQGAWRCNACARVFAVQMVTLDTTRIPGRVREEAELHQAELHQAKLHQAELHQQQGGSS